jgi:uncharacterized membrane-anchored protein YjiN (DUF445 family)
LTTVVVAADEAGRRRDLAAMKRRATGLLAVVSLVYLALVVLTGDDGWSRYARAAAEGGMVGGLADWFAVTALFRHPLGVPIPHTAVVKERKDQFGATLGSFVQENFLSADVVAERLRAARPADHLAAWLGEADHAGQVARFGTEVLVGASAALQRDAVARDVEAELTRVVAGAPLAPLAGRVLGAALARGAHEGVVDAFARELDRWLTENDEQVRRRVAEGSPWWLPGIVEDKVAARVIAAVRDLVAAVLADPHHELRAVVAGRLAELADRLEHDPALAGRISTVVGEVLGDPGVHRWWTELWSRLDGVIRDQAADPGSTLRRRLGQAVALAHQKLAGDPALRQRVDDAVVDAARTVVDRNRTELAGLVTGTMARWDADETSDKLELLLGRDLQFIRINGTVVGALAGVVITALAHLAG